MPNTPNYAIPYQSLFDQPHGPDLGEDGFIRVDTVLTGIDGRLTVVEGKVTAIEALTYRATQLLAAPAASVTFSAIPTTVRKLVLSWTARSSAAAVAQNLRIRVNNDSGANYNYNFTQQRNVTNTAIAGAAQTFWQIGVIPAATATANNFGSGEIVIPGWNAPHANLNQQHRSHMWESAADSWYQGGGGLYFAAAPYNRLDVFCDAGNLVAGSEFLLLGYI